MSLDQRGPAAGAKRVLNTGSGPLDHRLHPSFQAPAWQSVRLDIDPRVKPDLVGTIQDMRGLVPDASFDAIWSSHAMEHLYPHDVVAALKEFKRILRSDGFALITCPDLEQVARLILKHGLDATIYVSSAGPIACADVLFGHRAAVARGNVFMAHKTGFTADTLGSLILEAGFPEVHVGVDEDNIELWALVCMPQTRLDAIGAMLKGTRQAFLLP